MFTLIKIIEIFVHQEHFLGGPASPLSVSDSDFSTWFMVRIRQPYSFLNLDS